MYTINVNYTQLLQVMGCCYV